MSLNFSSKDRLLHLPPDRVPHKCISEKGSFCSVQRCIVTPPTTGPLTKPVPPMMSLAPSTLDPHTLAAYSHRMAPPTYSRGTTNPSRWVPPSMFTAPHRTVPDLHRPSDDPHGIFQDHYRPTSTPHSVAEPPTDAHLTARCVPELNGQGSEFIIADADTGGIACLPHGYLATPDHTHHPAPDDMNYFVQKSEYNRQEEFSQSCLLQSQDLKSSDRKFQTRASLYDFEDVLRHKINVHIEDFRLGLQHTLTGEFSDFSNTVHAQQQRPIKCGRYDSDEACMQMRGGVSVGSLDSYGGGVSVEGVTGEAADHASVDMDSGLSSSVGRGVDSSGIDAGLNRGEHSGTNSVVEDGGTLDMIDPTLFNATDPEGPKVDAALDHMIDQQLIELQTCASLITSILRRPEYAHVL